MSLFNVFSKLWRWISPPLPGEAGPSDPSEDLAQSAGSGTTDDGALAIGSIDDLDSELDAALSGANTGSEADDGAGPNRQDLAQNRELFAGIAANHLRPLKDFIYELKTDSAPKEWIEVCRPVIASLTEAADSMGLKDIAKLLKTLDREMHQAQEDRGPWPSRTWSERLVFIYNKLEQIEPTAFTIDGADHRRDSIIIHSLLRQVPDVGYVSLEKLYRVGLTSQEMLFQASSRDLVTTAGIPVELSERICTEIKTYHERINGCSADALKENGRKRLIERVKVLRDQHEAFKEARDAASVDRKAAERKRVLRRKRGYCALEIEVILAEMGEVAFAREIQSLAFEQRIKKLEQYLASSTESQTNANLSDADQSLSPTAAGI